MERPEPIDRPQKQEQIPEPLESRLDLWGVPKVQDWLRGHLGLAEHCDAFLKHRIDGSMLQQIDDQDLRDELGVHSRLQRKRILVSIASMQTARGA